LQTTDSLSLSLYTHNKKTETRCQAHHSPSPPPPSPSFNMASEGAKDAKRRNDFAELADVLKGNFRYLVRQQMGPNSKCYTSTHCAPAGGIGIIQAEQYDTTIVVRFLISVKYLVLRLHYDPSERMTHYNFIGYSIESSDEEPSLDNLKKIHTTSPTYHSIGESAAIEMAKCLIALNKAFKHHQVCEDDAKWLKWEEERQMGMCYEEAPDEEY